MRNKHKISKGIWQVIDQRDIKYDLTEHDFRPGAEIQIALVQARIVFSATNPDRKNQLSTDVKYFDGEICPAHVVIHFNANQHTRKKEANGSVSLCHQLGRCSTDMELKNPGHLTGSMYVLAKDVDKAKEVIKNGMHERMRDLAKVIKSVTADIKNLSGNENEPTP